MRRAFYAVSVAGQDISSRLMPLLTSLSISDKEGRSSDTASIEIDDGSMAIRFPQTGDPMSVSLGWEGEGLAVVFEGVVDSIQSTGSRGGGRMLSIGAKGFDAQGKAKQRQQLHIDNADVKTALTKAGEVAGITDIRVDPSLASITREWWGLDNESFINFGDRIAAEIGGIFKVRGNKAILASKTGGAVSGTTIPSITAAIGVNLIAWSLTPATARPRFKKVKSRWYDRKAARWKEKEAEVVDEGAEATILDEYDRADEGDAETSANAAAKGAEKDKGGGTIEIDGTAAARPGGNVILVGARPGVDGTYRIESIDHSYSRSSGWTTSLAVKRPGGSAGKDNRGKAGGQPAADDDSNFSLPTDPELG